MPWPFTGREAELRLVAELLDGGGAGVIVDGPAGVGKTRLLGELAALAEARGRPVAWVRATGSARTIPLGAFAPLLPPGEPAEGAELLARARRALAGRDLVLCVDDGQLLDDASAALLHQLVAAREVFAVVGVRREDPAPDALRALWKDDLSERILLGELSRDEADALLASGLGGPVDGRTRHALWVRTRGNVLYLRELVRHGLDRSLLVDDGGVWRWRGELEAGTRLAELVELRVGDAGDDARRVLELIAVGAPLELGVLRPAELAVLEGLERRELVQRRSDGRRRLVDVAHPLHGEAVRARLVPARLEAIHCRLADALEAHGTRRGGDVLRLAVHRLEAGAGGHGALYLAAAQGAFTALDDHLGERLARAAVAAEPSFAARLALARALARGARGDEAEDVLAVLRGEALDDGQRAAAALVSARNLFWALDRGDEAVGLLEAAEREVSDPDLRHELAAQRVRLVAGQGRPAAALAAARPLLADASVSERARLTAAIGATEALLSSGRTDEAVALVETWLPIAERRYDEVPHAANVLRGMRPLAQRLAGRLVEATAYSEAAYAVLLQQHSAQGIAVEATMLGQIWLARGRPRTALRCFRESSALLRDGDAVGMLAFAVAGIAQAAAQAGDAAAAQAAAGELERTPLGHRSFAVDVALGRAWATAAAGEASRARTLAADAAALAVERGQDGYAVRALHDLCRLGDPAAAAPPLARLAGSVDGPYAGVAAAHAAALVAGDGAALLAAAERLAELDALLVAAEAALAAAAAHREAGLPSSARVAEARAAGWLESCEDARPPTLPGPRRAAGLTAREREVALLAAGGTSSREIADRLVLSVRTVDNHLQNAYRKLGVTSRQELPSALDGRRDR
jgi:DNA-binding CsgD family transcriptional regulator